MLQTSWSSMALSTATLSSGSPFSYLPCNVGTRRISQTCLLACWARSECVCRSQTTHSWMDLASRTVFPDWEKYQIAWRKDKSKISFWLLRAREAIVSPAPQYFDAVRMDICHPSHLSSPHLHNLDALPIRVPDRKCHLRLPELPSTLLEAPLLDIYHQHSVTIL